MWTIVKTADKLHDFLMNPKSRPDLQTPEAQAFLADLERNYHNEKTDQLMPWLTREWKKGRLLHTPRGIMWHNPENRTVEEENTNRDEPTTLGPTRVNHWADFMGSNHPLKREMGDIMQHHIGDMQGRVQAWDQDMRDKAEEAEKIQAKDDGDIVHQWPDGWTIRRLGNAKELKREGDVMGHCVGSYADPVEREETLIHSLRDPHNNPHATIEIEPNMWEDYDGNTHSYDDEDGRDHTRQVVPHGGSVVQIQGKGNTDPKPEYKHRIREWFERLPQRPYPAQPGPLHGFGEDDEITNPEFLEEHDFNTPHDHDPYGIGQQPRPVNWNKMMTNMVDYSERYPSQSNLYHNEVYNFAKQRGEIPQMAKEWEGYDAEERNRMDEANFPYEHDQIGPHPELIEDEDQAERYGYEKPWHEMDKQEQQWATNEYEDRQDQFTRHAEEEWPTVRAANKLGELLRPHYSPETNQYENEIYQKPEQTF